ncbi:MAG TPA: TlpA disulfide reductase family protein [Thermoleophilaceae bacterium]|nr:TlpA disulfide reductase family protein [Thermoleophilaceae bacterium]
MKRIVSPLPLAVGLAVIALVALLVYGVNSSGPSRTLDGDLARGAKPVAPALDLTSLHTGQKASLAQYRGKVVLLNVWASWCTPCRDESPLLQRWHERMQSRGGTVLGVDTLDIKGDALNFIREYKLTYPQLNDRDGTSIKRLGTAAYPESFLIDKHGRITALQRGPVDDGWMRTHVEPLLRSS